MANKRHHISIRIVTLILAFVLVLPSAVKFTHALSQHEHDVCLEKHQTHFHNVDLDCEFFKFKIQTQHSAINVDYELFSVVDNHNISVSNYTFISDYQRLHFSLRGPPHYS